ncbi:MAG: hypothetical protein WCJ29_02155 [bacterium]
MSHYNAVVLVERGERGLEQIESETVEMLEKFNINTEVPPYKTYISPEQIKSMAEYTELDPSDLKPLAAYMKTWDGTEGGVDEGGLFNISTQNPEGHFDYCVMLGEARPENYGVQLFGEGNQERIVLAVFTPDGKWIQGPMFYGAGTEEDNRELDAWIEKVKKILEENKDKAVLVFDCHI